ncbi:dual-specificity RNA methyltransferase RlmN [Hordeum vulgare]|nr:dual-specificity RNA methyltransferase RlmN [Hordeum vulgare]
MAAVPLLRWGASSIHANSFPPPRRRLFSALRHPPAAARYEPGPRVRVMLKGMDYPELEKWVQSQGFRPGQAMMLWKCLYGNNVWAHCHDELAGRNYFMPVGCFHKMFKITKFVINGRFRIMTSF